MGARGQLAGAIEFCAKAVCVCALWPVFDAAMRRGGKAAGIIAVIVSVILFFAAVRLAQYSLAVWYSVPHSPNPTESREARDMPRRGKDL